LFKITTETAVAAGIRRIEAITGEVAENYYKEKATKLDSIAQLLKNPKDLQKGIEDLISNNNLLAKQLEQFQKEKSLLVKADLKQKINTIDGVNFLGEIVELDGGSIKDILFQLKGETANFFGVLGGKEADKHSSLLQEVKMQEV
jgi:alanyl-tRNA synthetase